MRILPTRNPAKSPLTKLQRAAREYWSPKAVARRAARDFDVVAIPWVPDAGEPQAVVDAILGRYALKQIDGSEVKEHGRLVYTLSFGGDAFLDVSFMPRQSTNGSRSE